MNQLDILSHVWNVSSSPTTIRWTSEQNWHPESCSEFMPTVPTILNNAFNIWIKLTCWFIFLNFPGLFLRNAMFNVWLKMASWIILEISVPCPTEQYVEDMETYLESFLKFTAPWPYKAIHLTYGESWHVEYFLECSLPCTYKAKGWTIEASWHVGSFLKVLTSHWLHKAVPATYDNIW